MANADWTPAAEDDLSEIAYQIAIEDSRPATARKIIEEIRDKADWYASSSDLGQRNLAFPEGWMYFSYKRWIVLYIRQDHGIDVLRVVDGARDYPRLF